MDVDGDGDGDVVDNIIALDISQASLHVGATRSSCPPSPTSGLQVRRRRSSSENGQTIPTLKLNVLEEGAVKEMREEWMDCKL